VRAGARNVHSDIPAGHLNNPWTITVSDDQDIQQGDCPETPETITEGAQR
jgi:hypothetical protein